MSALKGLVKRNTKLFFKDKAMLFTSLITPVILLVLYMTFLGNIYRESFYLAIPQGFHIPESLMNGAVGGQLVSSLLAVCCVTVSFCSNMLLVQDKVNGSKGDLTITPVKQSVLALGYYIATVLTTAVICIIAVGVGLIYLAGVGWYLTVVDVLFILSDVILLVLFGTAISSIVNYFLSSQGQISLVGTIVGAGYGFVCGAYMPISQFNETLQRVISFMPGTYGTSLLRNHCFRGVLAELEAQGLPADTLKSIRDSIDCNLYFFGEKVEVGVMYCVLVGAIFLLMAVYILINVLLNQKKR